MIKANIVVSVPYGMLDYPGDLLEKFHKHKLLVLNCKDSFYSNCIQYKCYTELITLDYSPGIQIPVCSFDMLDTIADNEVKQ